jgi:predicted transcriptional regulator
MGDLSDFQRRRTVGARVAGASVNKMASLLGVSRAAVSKIMQHTQIMERRLKLRGIVVENQK